MRGMSERRLKTIEGRTETYRQTLLEIDCYYSSVDLIAEIRRLREENKRLEKQLKGIGAEQYYSMRQRFWDEQKKNVALHKEVMRLEKDHHVSMNNCRSDIQIWQEGYERRYVDLAKQNAELAEVLRKISNYPQFEETNNGDR